MKKHQFTPNQPRDHDPAFVLAELRRACSHPRLDEGDDRLHESKIQAEALVSWFEKTPTSTTSKKLSSRHQLSGDHRIHPDEVGGTILLETLPGNFGQTVDPDFNPPSARKRNATETIPLVDATPEEYLERMVLINKEFKAGWMILGGIEKDGKLIVRTCAAYPEAENPKANEVGPWLEEKGWLSVENHKRTFYSSSKDLLIVQIQGTATQRPANPICPVTGFLISRPCENLKKHFGLVSDDLVAPENCPFENGPVDPRLVSAFLHLVDERNQPLFKAHRPDPDQGLEAQLDERINRSMEFEEALKKRAEALVNRMNRNTIKQLALRLAIPLPDNWTTVNPSSLDDPVKGPLLLTLRDDALSTKNRHPARKYRYLESLLEHEFEEFESVRKVTVPRPELPCTLTEALRYLVQNPTESGSVIGTAFQAYLQVVPSVEEMESEKREAARLKAKISDLAARIASRQSLRIPSNPKFEKTQEGCEAELKNLAEIQRSRDNFEPGGTIHPDLVRKAEIGWFRFSRETRPVDKLAMLELLKGGFREFWGKYHKAFQDLSKSNAKSKESISTKRRDAGGKGPAARHHGDWIELTKDFCAYVDKQVSHQANGDMLQWRDTFVANINMGKHAQLKRKEFLGTLITLSKKPPVDRDFGEALITLRAAHVLALKKETIEFCAKELDCATVKNRL